MKPRRAECIRIRKSDGAQCFKVYDRHTLYKGGGYTYEWLRGIDCSPGVEVGDKGTVAYVKSPMRGYYRFTKDKAREGKE